MPRFSPHSGEGAVSTGLMVVVEEAKSVDDARTIVELLEANQIVALVNLEVEGILFPWKEPPKKGAARVLVPSSMLPAAREVLRRAQSQPRSRSLPGVRSLRSLAEKSSPKPPPPPTDPMGAKMSAPLFGGDVVPRAPTRFWGEKQPDAIVPSTPEEETDEGPIDLELPEPRPLTGRILIAMTVIALGTGFQRLLETWRTPGDVLALFGAKWPITEDLYRIVTAGFLHSGPEHFFSNAMFGILLGVVLFGTHEVGATAFVWLFSSIIGLGTEASLSTSAAFVVGASAGNYGLVGLWANGQIDRARHSLLPRRQLLQTIGLVLLLVPGALTPITSTGARVAVIAHGFGFLAGFVLGFVFKRRLLPDGFASITRRSRVALLIAAGIMAVTAVRVAFLFYGM
jgi:membrane associated rhomboid family serine protease